MDIASMVKRAKGILLDPKREWAVIGAEHAGHSQVALSWLLPLSLIPAVAGFIGYGLIGFSVNGMRFASLNWGLRHGLMQPLAILGGAYITAFILKALAEKFASREELDKSFALVAYAWTPACLGGIFQIIPSLAFIGSLVGLYSLYLLYTGLPLMLKTPPEKNISYFVVTLLCAIGVFIVLSALLVAVFMPGLH